MRPVGVLLISVAAAVAGPLAANAAIYPGAPFGGLGAAAWAINPQDSTCQTELELVSRSGAIAPIAFISDGERVALRFTKAGAPSEAFLPIRVDGKPFSNLVQREGDEGLALMNLSDETLSALRHGKTLQIAWLGDEAVSASLAGAGQGFIDLKSCGAQVANQRRARDTAAEAERVRVLADARARAVSDEQLRAAKAQTAAAEAERDRVAAEAQKVRAQADQMAAQADEARQRMVAEQERQRAIAAQRAYYGYYPPPNSEAPPPQPYYPPRYYYPR